MLAARAVGLDCGPMSGFKNDVVDAAFFPDGRFKSNFLCCLGHGDPSTLPKQDHKFSFDEACTIA
jgi:3-hydroxypropanoate dehydrogenase